MTDELERVENDILTPLWWAGYNWLYTTAGIALGGAFLGRAYIDLWTGLILGLVGGHVLWFAGTRHVNDRYDDVLDAFEADAKREARDVLGFGGDVRSYTFRYGTGSAKLVSPSKEYDFTTMVVGESSLAIHDDAHLEMPLLDGHIGKSTREFYFDQITSVDYDEPHFQVKSSDGELIQYRSSTRPDDVLYTVQDRLREFKSG